MIDLGRNWGLIGLGWVCEVEGRTAIGLSRIRGTQRGLVMTDQLLSVIQFSNSLRRLWFRWVTTLWEVR